MERASGYREFEDRFINQLRARALALTKGALPADRVAFEATSEGRDALRAELSRLEVYDRDALDRLPGSNSLGLRFVKRRLGGLLEQPVSRVRARALFPVEALVREGGAPGPIGREQVLDALARYDVLPQRVRPTGVILASPTGFTEEARRLVETVAGDKSLILMGGREDGGWDVALPGRLRGTPWEKLFEFETQDQRVQRLLKYLQANAAVVDTRGVSLRDLADELGIAEREAERLVRLACRSEPRLMTVKHDGVLHVCRTPLADEGNRMSLWSRIRRMLGMKPTVAERVRELTAQRVRAEQQRAEVDAQIEKLEEDERSALHNGAAAKSDAEKKQIANRLMRVRRELKRYRAQAAVFTRQLDVIGAHIHNLTLAEQGRQVSLPAAEELTATAAEAEGVIAELSANAELARGVEVSDETFADEEETAGIFAEFDQIASTDATPAEVSKEHKAADEAVAKKEARAADLPETPVAPHERSEPATRASEKDARPEAN